MCPGAALALPVYPYIDENFHRTRHCPAFSHEKIAVRAGGEPMCVRFAAIQPARLLLRLLTCLLQRGNNAAPFHFF
jgi:hypothetical protein